MAYDYPTDYGGGLNVSGPGGFFMDYPNTIITNFAGGILLLIWMTIFAVSSYMGSKKSLLVSCFVTSIFAIFFVIREWVNPIVAIMLGIITIIAAIGIRGEGSY